MDNVLPSSANAGGGSVTAKTAAFSSGYYPHSSVNHGDRASSSSSGSGGGSRGVRSIRLLLGGCHFVKKLLKLFKVDC